VKQYRCEKEKLRGGTPCSIWVTYCGGRLGLQLAMKALFLFFRESDKVEKENVECNSTVVKIIVCNVTLCIRGMVN
jgi:hypothetical protein